MSACFWVGIVCNGCGAVHGGREETDRTEYQEALTLVRTLAAQDGWSFHKGHRNRHVDLCRPCNVAQRAS